jgi:diguanylate cyclase (GGDEF)-like protein/PAS domain S-box-containing protein
MTEIQDDRVHYASHRKGPEIMFSKESLGYDFTWENYIHTFQESLKTLTIQTWPQESDHLQRLVDQLSCAIEELKVQNEELQLLHQELWLERQRYLDFFNFAPDAYLITDASGVILEANQASTQLLGLPPTFFIGKPLVSFIDPANLAQFYEHLFWAKHTFQAVSFELTLSSRQIKRLPVEVRIVATQGQQDDTLHLRWLIRDISARKQAEEQLRQQALYDTLTGLPNRPCLLQKLNEALKIHRRMPNTHVAVLFLDLDGFKHINENLGHLAGDQLLRIVAQRLLSCIRPNDTVARFGGDEFAILLNQIHAQEEALTIAERIHETLASPIEIDGKRLIVFTSIGIAVTPKHSIADFHTQAEALLSNADLAMYKAKEHGTRRTQLFTSGLRSHSENVVSMKTEFRDALERQEFTLFYQPIVNICTGQLHGVEALVRWQHPRLGLVSYDKFSTVAQQTKTLSILEHKIFLDACVQGKFWIENYNLEPDFTLHINVSANRFMDETFLDDVSAALSASDFPVSQLTIELTESSLIRNPRRMAWVLEELRKLGIAISLDDFGSGYSSLSHLSSFPITEIKIDPLFIRQLHQNKNLAAIVSNTINLGRDLRLNVIAEGIETEGQLQFLLAAHCQQGQGYFFSQPLNAEVFGNVLSPPLIGIPHCLETRYRAG